MLPRPRVPRRVALVSLTAVLLGALAYGAATVVVANPACAEPGPADAIVVLGASVWDGGRPSPALERRASRGAELWLDRRAPVLVLSGASARGRPSEAEVMARIAEGRGVPTGAILLEPNGVSTETSAGNVRALGAAHGWRRVILVSEPYHLLRAAWMFRDRGLDVEPACAGRSPDAWSLAYQPAREVTALAAYALTRG